MAKKSIATIKTNLATNEFLRSNGVNAAYFRDTVVKISEMIDLSRCSNYDLLEIHNLFKKYHITREGIADAYNYINFDLLKLEGFGFRFNLQAIDIWAQDLRRLTDNIITPDKRERGIWVRGKYYDKIIETAQKLQTKDIALILKFLCDEAEYNNDLEKRFKQWISIASVKKQFTVDGKLHVKEAKIYFKNKVYKTIPDNKEYLLGTSYR
ncbi:MAG: hypothetical protein J6A59_00550 [Lachnospiraceae bacterium]|nr:hypothetical protein [Lachnospiraceae bacterium]